MNKTKIVCILSMHRSGSSMASGILKKNGISFGHNLIGGSKFNRDGHYEDRNIVAINKKLLLYLGGSWDRPKPLPPKWEENKHLKKLLNDAKKYFQNHIYPYEFFAFKDPRTCLTLPFWQLAFGKMHYLIILRNPEDVVLSIKKRNDTWLRKQSLPWRAARTFYHFLLYRGAVEKIRPISTEKSFELWRKYNRSIAQHCGGHESLLMKYEDILENPKETTEQILSFVNPDIATHDYSSIKAGFNHGSAKKDSPEYKKTLQLVSNSIVKR